MRPWILLAIVLSACDVPSSDPGETLEPSEPEGSEVVGILLLPEEATVSLGGELDFKAVGLRADRTTTDLTAAVEWSVSDASVGEVLNELDAEGRFTTKSSGTLEVTAAFEGQESVSAVVTVTDAEVLGLSISPETLIIAPGQEQTLNAQVAFSDGSSSSAAGQVRWITSEPAIATVLDGVVTGVSAGDASVVAKMGDVKSEPATIEVKQGAAPDLQVGELTAFRLNPEVVRLSAEVTNEGNTGVGDVWVDVFVGVSEESDIGDIGDWFEQAPWIGPGETAQVTLDLFISSDVLDLAVVADIDDLIEESNEGNNTRLQTIELADELGEEATDLRIVDLDFILDEDSVYFEIELSNDSTVEASEVELWVWLDSDEAPFDVFAPDEVVEVGAIGGLESTFTSALVDRYCTFCVSWVEIVPVGLEDVYPADNQWGPEDVSDYLFEDDSGVSWDSGTP